MSWTPERVETLKEMWSEGKSASQIAGDLGGVTRNAVIGKVHRLGLSNRESTIQKDQKEEQVREKLGASKLKKKMMAGKESSINVEATTRTLNKQKTHLESEKKGLLKSALQVTKKPIVFTANQPLPPQPSTSEISEETLKNVKSIEKKSRKLSLMELTERTCKWPIGDPATEEFWFCGHTAEAGKPYCETHIEIAFQPVTARRERRSR